MDLTLWDLTLCICNSFSLVTSTYDKFILILFFFFWVSEACVCCCDWQKLWLLVIFSRILLIMFGWVNFIGNNRIWSIKKEETTLPLQLAWCWELHCMYWSACEGFLYTYTEILPLLRFNKVSRNVSFPLLSSSIVNLMF